jgi:uncharacterized SAM-binding protein YcdF (DUF218 family)
MFLLLTRVLLWVLIAFILWNLFSFFSGAFGTVGRVLILILLAWAFLDPNNPFIGVIGQILLFPLKPLGLSLILLIGAGALKNYGKSKQAQNQLTAAFLILLLSSVPIIAYWLAQQSELAAIDLEQRLQRTCQEQVCPATGATPGTAPAPGAIVVLGQAPRGSVPYLTQAQTADTSDRLIYASQLYRDAGNNPYVIVSTDVAPTQVNRTTATTTVNPNEAPGSTTTTTTTTTTPATSTADEPGIRALLTGLGVPSDRIFVEPSAPDIYNTARNVKRRLDDLNINRVAVVAPVLTSRRAALSFNQLGVEAAPRSADTYIRQLTPFPTVVSTAPDGQCSNVTLRICNLSQLRFVDFIPSADALALTNRVWEEFLLSVYYFLRGWMSPLT